MKELSIFKEFGNWRVKCPRFPAQDGIYVFCCHGRACFKDGKIDFRRQVLECSWDEVGRPMEVPALAILSQVHKDSDLIFVADDEQEQGT